MTGRGGGGRKVLLPPINFIFKLLQSHAPVKIWLYEQLSIRIEGKIRVGHLHIHYMFSRIGDIHLCVFVSLGFRRIYEPGYRRRGRGQANHQDELGREKKGARFVHSIHYIPTIGGKGLTLVSRTNSIEGRQRVFDSRSHMITNDSSRRSTLLVTKEVFLPRTVPRWMAYPFTTNVSEERV